MEKKPFDVPQEEWGNIIENKLYKPKMDDFYKVIRENPAKVEELASANNLSKLEAIRKLTKGYEDRLRSGVQKAAQIGKKGLRLIPGVGALAGVAGGIAMGQTPDAAAADSIIPGGVDELGAGSDDPSQFLSPEERERRRMVLEQLKRQARPVAQPMGEQNQLADLSLQKIMEVQ